MHRVLAVALLLLTSLVAGPVGAAANTTSGQPATGPTGQWATQPASRMADGTATQQADVPTIQKSVELHLTPNEAGAIGISLSYDVPDEVTGLSVQLPADARDVRTTDFTRGSDGYEWDGQGETPSLELTLPANESTQGGRSPSTTQEGSYSFVDAGPWAMVTVPTLRTGWGWRNADSVEISTQVSVAGEGSTGGEIAYLGDVTEYTRAVNGQTFTLAVPDRASMASSPGRVLDALAAASQALRVGARDPEVWIGVGPMGVDWGIRGVEYGGDDAWVVADARLTEASNVWFHEYVHTRQDYSPARSGLWTVEAAAEYYAAWLAYDMGYVDFDAFATYLSYGEEPPWRDAVLANPNTWISGANYLKGSLVWGAVDRRMRLATDGSNAMTDVLWRLNRLDGQVTNDDFLDAVRAQSTPAVAAYAREHTATSAAARMWTRSQHVEAFDVDPPLMQYDVREYRVTGPYRNATFQEPPALYVGETLSVTASVTNDGGTAGTYVATFRLGDDTVAAARAELEPGASDAIALQHTFTTANAYNLTVGRNPVPLTVQQAATPAVESLSVSAASVSPGDTVTVTATLSNPTDGPASGPVALHLDGRQVAALNATLDAGESVTRVVNVTVADAGTHELTAGNQSTTIEATETEAVTPGFGVGVALAALAATALFALRRL